MKLGAVVGLCFLGVVACFDSESLEEEAVNFPSDKEEHLYNSQELVDYVNFESGAKWTAGFNDYFDGRLEEEARILMGAWLREPMTEEAAAKAKWAPTQPHDMHIPTEFDGRGEWKECPSLVEIRDQSACGSCWAFGAAEAMTDRICIASKGANQVRISSEDLLACCSSCGAGCDGGEPLLAWEFWQSHGIVTGGNYTAHSGCQPYVFPPCDHHIKPVHYKECPKALYPTPKCHHTCQASYKTPYSQDKHYGASAYNVPSDVAAIQKEIMVNGPVEAAFEVYADFPHYKTGVYHHVTGGSIGGHAVKILGWGEEGGEPFWLVANSWNKDWGEGGFFRIRRGSDECGIESQIVAGLPKL